MENLQASLQLLRVAGVVGARGVVEENQLFLHDLHLKLHMDGHRDKGETHTHTHVHILRNFANFLVFTNFLNCLAELKESIAFKNWQQV